MSEAILGQFGFTEYENNPGYKSSNFTQSGTSIQLNPDAGVQYIHFSFSLVYNNYLQLNPRNGNTGINHAYSVSATDTSGWWGHSSTAWSYGANLSLKGSGTGAISSSDKVHNVNFTVINNYVGDEYSGRTAFYWDGLFYDAWDRPKLVRGGMMCVSATQANNIRFYSGGRFKTYSQRSFPIGEHT